MLQYKEENREQAFASIWDVVPEEQKQELIDKYSIMSNYQNPLNNPSLRKEVLGNYSRKVRKVTVK